MEDIIFVKGNIIIESGRYKVKELVAFASDGWERIADVIKPDDFTISDRNTIMPYNILCASEDIVVYNDLLTGLQYPKEIKRIFNEEIDNLQRFRIKEIDEDLIDVRNRLVYTGVVGTMELFLCDFLLTMVLGYKENFNRFYEISSTNFKAKDGRIQDRIYEKIIKTNYHRIRDVQEIYQKVLNIEFPPIDKLEDLIITRHNLVHRIGYTGGTSEYRRVTPEMIDELIMEVKGLIDLITESKQMELENWIPDPSKND